MRAKAVHIYRDRDSLAIDPRFPQITGGDLEGQLFAYLQLRKKVPMYIKCQHSGYYMIGTVGVLTSGRSITATGVVVNSIERKAEKTSRGTSGAAALLASHGLTKSPKCAPCKHAHFIFIVS
jgi:hypothetical protein